MATMARSVSRGSIGADGTRVGDDSGGANVGARGELERERNVGSVIDGKYRLEGLLGEGGMGTVWWAHHLQLDLPVAVKLLRPGGDQRLLSERLKIEARAAAQLVHPAIVRVFDIDESEQGEPFIVMELLRGESLADLLERGRLSGQSAVQTMLPIAEALALAHSRGIVHRDLKPHNVFLAEEAERMQPKLLDFGIVKLMDQERQSGSLTDTGISVGSPDYMSPEQARGSNDVDYRTDIWSFCVVLYEVVTCETPFLGDNYNALMRAIVENEPLPLGEHIDARLAELISWGLRKEREERPKSIQELGRELARWLVEQGVTEDVCGASLDARWLARQPQKSAPLILLEPVPVPRPLPAGTGTLVSARRSQDSDAKPLSSANAAVDVVASPVSRPAARPAWAWALAALVLAAGIVWAAVGWRALTSPRASSASTSPTAPARPVATPGPVPPPAAGPTPIEIASSAATPARSAAPAPSAVSARDDVHSVSPGPSRAPKSGASPGNPAESPAAMPSSRRRDDHDETGELLQAY
jgi:eukaryotic-like serine/threonine-protein kinase